MLRDRVFDSRNSIVTATPQLIGASIPRSGHHYLVRVLRATLGSRAYYCERYTVGTCCTAIPCTRASGHDLAFLKSHDLDDELDPTRTDVRFVVQYRNAVEAILSDRELYVARMHPETVWDAGEYAYWLGKRAAYLIRFARKWLRNPRAHHYLLDYGELTRAPAASLRRLLAFCGVAFDETSLRAAIGKQSKIRDSHVPGTIKTVLARFNPRRIESSANYDPNLLAPFEALIADAAPELAAHRYFPNARVDESIVPFVALCRSFEGQPWAAERLPEIKRRLAALDHLAYAHVAAALALRAAGDLDSAGAALDRAVAMGVTDSTALVDAAHLHRAKGDLDRACEYARRLIETYPGHGSHELFLANLLLESGRLGEAIAHAVDALSHGISEQHLLAACSNILKHGRTAGYRIDVEIAPPPET